MKKLLFLLSFIAFCFTFAPTTAVSQAWSIKINSDQDPDSMFVMLSDTVFSKYRYGKFKSYNTEQATAQKAFDGSQTYKVVLTQASTNAPTASVKRNTLVAGTPVITRDSIGTYKLTKTDAFTSAKTTVLATINTGTAKFIRAYRQSDSTVIVRTEALTGLGADLTGTCTLEICVWPN